MTKFKVTILTTLLIIITSAMYISCNDEDPKEIVNQSENLFFKGVKIDPEIGIKHNIIVIDFLNRNKNLSSKSLIDKNKVIINYFNDKYGVDVTSNIQPYLKYKSKYAQKSENLAEFSPIDFINDHKENLSNHLYSQVIDLLTQTKEVSSNRDEVLKIIENFKTTLYTDNNYQINEKEAFTNYLLVFESSVKLWYDYDFNNDNFSAKNNVSAKLSPDNYWKIASADMVEGFAGGLLGGPAGALIGIASGSITMAIGLW